jgi:lipoyl(octanoyl) transferase
VIEFSTEGREDGLMNMVKDTALLLRADEGIVAARVYGWRGPWVSLGRFQRAEQELVADCAVPTATRPTGGRAVLHGHDVTVGLAVPYSVIQVTAREVKRAYRAVATPLIEALRGCGVDAELAERTPHSNKGDRAADCFGFNSANDIVDRKSGKKICGCALRMLERSVLVQASIPNGDPLVDPREVFRKPTLDYSFRWDSSNFGLRLEEALRYNFSDV